MNEERSEIADVMEEGEELLTRYAGAVPSTYGRNLQVLSTLAAVHIMAQGTDATVGDWMAELEMFFTAAYRMGVESVG